MPPKEPVIIITGKWEGTSGDYTITWNGENGSGPAELQETGNTYTIPLGEGSLVIRK